MKLYGEEFDSLFEAVKWNDFFSYDWKEVFAIFTSMQTTDNYNLEWKPVDEKKVMSVLVDRHEFSKSRVEDVLAKLKKEQSTIAQQGLGSWM